MLFDHVRATQERVKALGKLWPYNKVLPQVLTGADNVQRLHGYVFSL